MTAATVKRYKEETMKTFIEYLKKFNARKRVTGITVHAMADDPTIQDKIRREVTELCDAANDGMFYRSALRYIVAYCEHELESSLDKEVLSEILRIANLALDDDGDNK
jgi:hypothetical protein